MKAGNIYENDAKQSPSEDFRVRDDARLPFRVYYGHIYIGSLLLTIQLSPKPATTRHRERAAHFSGVLLKAPRDTINMHNRAMRDDFDLCIRLFVHLK